MFDLEQFVADCRTALGAGDAHAAVREVVARAVSDPGPMLRALGEPRRIFWRRVRDDPTRVEAAGARAISVKETLPMGRDIIHSVTNPIPRLTGAIHVYGGDFFAIPRSEWDPETLLEQPSDGDRNIRRFAEANALYERR